VNTLTPVKGVVLAGGTGSRLDPLTRITNKHLLPIYDRPMVLWAIEALVEAGVRELMLVAGGTHAGEFLRLLGNGHEWRIERLFYAYQEHPGGIAEALGLAEQFVGGDLVVVMLADNLYEEPITPTVERFADQGRGGRVLLARIDEPEHLRNLGVAQFEDGRITEIVEKPAEPPSTHAVTGLYCYDANVWEVIRELKPSRRGELEITDVNNWYVRSGAMEFDTTDGFWGDAGESIEAYYSVNEWIRRNRGR
jgi:glucose-1-phosphate thymidylyltransferase